MRADASIGANGGKHVEKRGVALPVLLRQVTDGRGKVSPRRRGMGELGAERLRAAGKRQHGIVAVTAHHRRKLEEIADQHHLQAAERRLYASDMTADGIDQVQRPRRQHRDLIDDEHLGLFDAGG
jgi:hypothetical protein